MTECIHWMCAMSVISTYKAQFKQIVATHRDLNTQIILKTSWNTIPLQPLGWQPRNRGLQFAVGPPDDTSGPRYVVNRQIITRLQNCFSAPCCLQRLPQLTCSAGLRLWRPLCTQKKWGLLSKFWNS